MWTETPVFRKDLERLCNCEFIPWKKLIGKTVLVTGATGLIGYTLSSTLLYYDMVHSARMKVLALVRNHERAQEKFRGQLTDQCNLEFVVGDVTSLPEIDGNVDYIIHGASPTASAYFVEKPVETIMTAVLGTRNLLELAKEKRVSDFVYLSSMEVYGTPQTDDLISETYPTAVDTMSVRSSYPQAKLLCENLCASYCGEYGVPAKVVRLAQTFGPGVTADDQRVFAQFARAVMNEEDIVLQTAGKSKRTYLYTADAVSAILKVLIQGSTGETYNAANPETYCSIYEMAQMVTKELTNEKIHILAQPEARSTFAFSPLHNLHLHSKKLCGLGWQPTVGLPDMYRRMLACF